MALRKSNLIITLFGGCNTGTDSTSIEWLDIAKLLLGKLALRNLIVVIVVIVVIVDQRFLLAILRKPDSTSVELAHKKFLCSFSFC